MTPATEANPTQIIVEGDTQTLNRFQLPRTLTLNEAISAQQRINSSGQGDALLVGETLVVRSLLID